MHSPRCRYCFASGPPRCPMIAASPRPSIALRSPAGSWSRSPTGTRPTMPADATLSAAARRAACAEFISLQDGRSSEVFDRDVFLRVELRHRHERGLLEQAAARPAAAVVKSMTGVEKEVREAWDLLDIPGKKA